MISDDRQCLDRCAAKLSAFLAFATQQMRKISRSLEMPSLAAPDQFYATAFIMFRKVRERRRDIARNGSGTETISYRASSAVGSCPSCRARAIAAGSRNRIIAE
jgi:hypothetical protein